MNAIAPFPPSKNHFATSERGSSGSQKSDARLKLHQRAVHVLVLLLCVLLLMACEASPQPQPQLSLPGTLFDLSPRPGVPVDPSDNDIARLLIEQAEWIDRTGSQVQRLRSLLAEHVRSD